MSVEATMAAYYAQRAAYYERVYFKPERQTDLRAMEAWIGQPFAGRSVLEVACGTGWWTPHAARDARHWLATDLNPETLDLARKKPGTLSLASPSAQQTVSLPVWIPGSYLVREFAKNLQCLQARQLGRPCTLRQLDKCTWQIDCAEGVPLTLSYQVYALDNSVRSAWLDASRGFFNGTSLFLRVHGQEARAHGLDLVGHPRCRNWQVATGLEPVKTDARGFGRCAVLVA
mgnify:CR=1 FL=1